MQASNETTPLSQIASGPMDLQSPEVVSAQQGRFIRYLFYVHIDVCVLALFAEYWDRVTIESFTVALLTAAVLQVMLKTTLSFEHRIGAYYGARPGTSAIVFRVLTTWLLLFSSKFVILEVVDVIFGDRVDLGGLLPFIVLSIALIVIERVVARAYESLT